MRGPRGALGIGFALWSVAGALAPACGQVTVPGDAAAGAPDAGQADPDVAGAPDAGDGRPPDGASSSCPAAIAPCVAALQALRATCRGAGVCQTETEASSVRVNACYADGVRVYSDPGLITVVRGDGRLCYTIAGGLTGALIDQTVEDPSGAIVVRLTRTVSGSYQTLGCGASSVDVPDSDRPCGDTSLLPPDLGCLAGTCLRP